MATNFRFKITSLLVDVVESLQLSESEEPPPGGLQTRVEDRPGTSSSSCLPNKVRKKRNAKILKTYSFTYLRSTFRTDWAQMCVSGCGSTTQSRLRNAVFEILGTGQSQLFTRKYLELLNISFQIARQKEGTMSLRENEIL